MRLEFEYLHDLGPKERAKELNRLVRETGLPLEEIYQKKQTIDEIFHKNLPNTLYMSHYDLSISYGYTPQEWRTYLRDNYMFIETELAAIAEAEARSALARLGNASGQEVTALKAILEKSKLINDAQKQNVKITMTFIPPSNKEDSALNDKRNDDPRNMYETSRPFDREEPRLWEQRPGTI